MYKLSILLGLLASVTPSLAAAAASSADVHRYDGEVNEGSYIVKLRDGAQKSTVLSRIGSFLGGNTRITHEWDPNFFNGFAGYFGDDVIEVLRSSVDVEYIAEDGIMSTFDTKHPAAVMDPPNIQADAPWGLARISTRTKLVNQDPLALYYEYKYLPNPGRGVDIYVVDTGILVEHPDFEDRARWGGVFCQDCIQVDDNGHGTHVAGTAGGKKFGVAKAASLIAVKVLNAEGSGSVSDIISGLAWIGTQHANSGRPSIATMSLGGTVSLPLNQAVQTLVGGGVHCTVAAGNDGMDADLTSPASTREAITVGASDITDSRAYYSNFGLPVDIFAPGSNVTSTWNDGGYAVHSGTSMATPHVAGLVAYLLPIIGLSTTPAEMSNVITALSTPGALSDVPPLTPNNLAFNNVTSS